MKKKTVAFDRARFAHDIIIARQRKGLNRAQCAEAVGIHSNSFKNYEDAIAFPQPDKWEIIREVTGINPADYSTIQPPKRIAGDSYTMENVSGSIQGEGNTITRGGRNGHGEERPGEITIKVTPEQKKAILLTLQFGDDDDWEWLRKRVAKRLAAE